MTSLWRTAVGDDHGGYGGLGFGASSSTRVSLGQEGGASAASRTKTITVSIQAKPAVAAGSGEELGRPVGADAIASDLPQTVKGMRAADRVRVIAEERESGTWSRFAEEVRVQKLVWESIALTKKDSKSAIDAADAQLSEVTAAQDYGDFPAAIRLLDGIVERAAADGERSVLSQSMLRSARSILDLADTKAGLYDLAQQLQHAGSVGSTARNDEERKRLEAVVDALGDKKLERTVRQVLHLPFAATINPQTATPSERRPSGRHGDTQLFAPVTYVSSRKLSDLVGKPPAAPSSGSALLGAPGKGQTLHVPVYMSGSRTMNEIVKGMRSGSGFDAATGAATSGGPARKTLSNLVGSVGAVAAASESLRSSTSRKGTPADAVRRLAAESPGKAWEQLQRELDVQRMVWQSVMVTRIKPDARQAFQAQTDGAAKTVQDILDSRSADLQRALSGVEQLFRSMPKDSTGDDIINMATQNALQDVLNQHEAAPLRMDLAERLDVANVPATLPRGPAQKAEVEQLVVKCCLGDKALEREVRQMLLLPIPESVGAAVTVTPTSSKVSKEASGRRSGAPAGAAAASRKDSVTQPTTRGAPKTGFGPGSFEPPPRDAFAGSRPQILDSI